MAQAARRRKTAKAAGSGRQNARAAGAAPPEEERARRSRRRGWAEWPFSGQIGDEAGTPFWGTVDAGPFYGKPCEGPGAADSILSQAMLMAALGPASALFAANHADALMFYNAVANQQKTNILGMSVTAKCVRYMFEVGEGPDDEEYDVLAEVLREPWQQRE